MVEWDRPLWKPVHSVLLIAVKFQQIAVQQQQPPPQHKEKLARIARRRFVQKSLCVEVTSLYNKF
jgi:hypothetical protein